MTEMLFYMYSGRSTSLQTNALDLLVVADRFQLIGKSIGNCSELTAIH